MRAYGLSAVGKLFHLEYIVIPGLQETIKFLNMKFEERDREEKSRLKRVKVILQRE